MSKLTYETLKNSGWRPVDKNVSGNGRRSIACGYIYVKENLQLAHDEIINYVTVKTIGGATPRATILKGEFKTLEEFNTALEGVTI